MSFPAASLDVIGARACTGRNRSQGRRFWSLGRLLASFSHKPRARRPAAALCSSSPCRSQLRVRRNSIPSSSASVPAANLNCQRQTTHSPYTAVDLSGASRVTAFLQTDRDIQPAVQIPPRNRASRLSPDPPFYPCVARPARVLRTESHSQIVRSDTRCRRCYLIHSLLLYIYTLSPDKPTLMTCFSLRLSALHSGTRSLAGACHFTCS